MQDKYIRKPEADRQNLLSETYAFSDEIESECGGMKNSQTSVPGELNVTCIFTENGPPLEELVQKLFLSYVERECVRGSQSFSPSKNHNGDTSIFDEPQSRLEGQK